MTRIRALPRCRAALAAALLVALASGASGAERPAVRMLSAAVLAHDVGGLWSGEHVEGGADVGAEVELRRALVRFAGGVLRPVAGFTVNTDGGTDILYGGGRWERPLGRSSFVALGLGLAVHDGRLERDRPERKGLGARVLFRVPVEIGLEVGPRWRLVLAFAHVSNAYLASPNDGLDTVGIRAGILF